MKLYKAAAVWLLMTGTLRSEPVQSREERIRAAEQTLNEAHAQLAKLSEVIHTLSEELRALKEPSSADVRERMLPEATPGVSAEVPDAQYRERVLGPGLGGDERAHELSGRPELFVQTRYQTLPLKQAENPDIRPNFALTRMETRWSGRLSQKVGVGFELQYHPAPQGSSFEIVNDAFLEYYPTDALTVRVGQFIKPFGFDIQQSSSVRESPERGIFAGYFFPGQRDRGIMLTAKLDGLADAFAGTTLYAAALNGNRFFDDNNRNLNYNVRLRKLFSGVPLAFGVSAQIGRQVVPAGLSQADTREHIYGADVQYVWKRVGVRTEYVVGNTPSTLLDLEPDFAAAFRPGARSKGAVAFGSVRLTNRDDVYARFDQFTNDPVTGAGVRAFNIGYLRAIGDSSRVSVDYQFKNRLSYNDDHLNTRLQISWNVIY